MPRIDVFIDGQNFSIACRQLIDGYVDVKAFARMIAKKTHHELGETFLYDSPSPTREVQRRKQVFWEALRATPGVTLRIGRTESNFDGTHREKECDVMLAVDMVVRAFHHRYDRAILVSADTDQAHAIQAVHDLGLEVGWAYLPTQDYIDHLRQLIPEDRRLELSEKILRPVRQQNFRR